MAQRLVRAKRKIRDAGIPYVVPETKDMAERLDAVLTAIYLVFNEGYAATRGGPLVRTDLCAEAIRLGRLVRSLMEPQVPSEVTALLALMLLHDARRDARSDDAGDLIVLEEQDRSLWHQQQIAEPCPLWTKPFAAPPALTLCKRLSPLCIVARRGLKIRTGVKSFNFTTSLSVCNRLRLCL
jgi:RNA polymerase sigma-70 factor (ECF subfamily)